MNKIIGARNEAPEVSEANGEYYKSKLKKFV